MPENNIRWRGWVESSSRGEKLRCKHMMKQEFLEERMKFAFLQILQFTSLHIAKLAETKN
jgi:hypothetical protein